MFRSRPLNTPAHEAAHEAVHEAACDAALWSMKLHAHINVHDVRKDSGEGGGVGIFPTPSLAQGSESEYDDSSAPEQNTCVSSPSASEHV
jgi:hypothetical protein